MISSCMTYGIWYEKGELNGKKKQNLLLYWQIRLLQRIIKKLDDFTMLRVRALAVVKLVSRCIHTNKYVKKSFFPILPLFTSF